MNATKILEICANQTNALRIVSEFVYNRYLFFTTQLGDDIEIEVLPGKLVFHPSEDPNKLRLALEKECDIVFSRQLTPSGAYNWHGMAGNVEIVIAATEVFDVSGTIVTE